MITEKNEGMLRPTFEKSTQAQQNIQSIDSNEHPNLRKTFVRYGLVDGFVFVMIVVISLMLFFPITMPIISYLLKLLGIDISW